MKRQQQKRTLITETEGGKGMSYNFFAYIARMKYISRWGLMRNAVQENIQEHSHMVAVLAHTLAVIRRDVLGVDCDPGAAAVAALYHDAPISSAKLCVMQAPPITTLLLHPFSLHISKIGRAHV